MVFQWLVEASLTLNLGTCEFGKATVTYLGKVNRWAHGQVRPVDAKVTAVVFYPVPTTRRELRWFLGMTLALNCVTLLCLLHGTMSRNLSSVLLSLFSAVPLSLLHLTSLFRSG